MGLVEMIGFLWFYGAAYSARGLEGFGWGFLISIAAFRRASERYSSSLRWA